MASTAFLNQNIPSSPAFLVVCGICLAYYATRLLSKGKKYQNVSLPPGPKGWPFFGSVFDVPRTFEWKAYREWCRKAGSDIIHFRTFGMDIIVIDKYEAAIDLLEKRSGIYSSRDDVPMAELLGWDIPGMGFNVYGNLWRTRRRLFHQIMNEHTNDRFFSLIQRNTSQLLVALLDTPEQCYDQIAFNAARTVLELGYGLDTKSPQDQRLINFESVTCAIMQSTLPGAYLVNIFPILKYIPAWFPGAYFKTYARKIKALSKIVIEDTYYEAKNSIFKDGNTTPSVVYNSLSEKPTVTKEEEEDIMAVAVNAYIAGSDTSTSMLQNFILLMVHNPEVQKRAKDEIAHITQPGHLPLYKERDSYPYLNAIVKETFRITAIVPMAIPHKLLVDDIYQGYHIPAGSIVIPNSWSMLHDETVYPDPDAFKPERFLKDGKIDPDVRNPLDIAFGFGRRICPGRHLALMAFWTNAASILATFNLKNMEGGPTADHEHISGLVVHPTSFKCDIKPSSLAAETLVREFYAQNH